MRRALFVAIALSAASLGSTTPSQALQLGAFAPRATLQAADKAVTTVHYRRKCCYQGRPYAARYYAPRYYAGPAYYYGPSVHYVPPPRVYYVPVYYVPPPRVYYAPVYVYPPRYHDAYGW